MSNEVWIAVGIIFVIVWGWIIWEIWTAPLMPDDYDPYSNGGNMKVNGSKDEEQHKTGFYNGKTDKWIKNK